MTTPPADPPWRPGAARHLVQRLAEAAARTANTRTRTRTAGGAGRGAAGSVHAAADDAATTAAGPGVAGGPAAELVALEEIPTGWTAYGRAIWPLGDGFYDDRILIEGTDRRSYAALSYYLRQGEDLAAARARGLPRFPPTVAAAAVVFERAGDMVRVRYQPGPHDTGTHLPGSQHRHGLAGVAPVAVLVADR